MLRREQKVKKKKRAPPQFRRFAARGIASPTRAAQATRQRNYDLASDDHENGPWFFRERATVFQDGKKRRSPCEQILKASGAKGAAPGADPISAG
jgi:hypothetical protein